MTLDPSGINFSWLIKLRWSMLAGQLVTILVVERAMGIPLPLVPLAALLAVELVSNVVCVLAARGGRPVASSWSGAVMALDTALLTAMLYFTGGAFNPFSFFYLVQIALAAMILRARWTWALVALALVGSGVLFVASRPLAIDMRSHDEHLRVHLRGMWVAFGGAATFIVYFLLRVRRELEEARHLAARQERLASLATLAAGAAHELATPLSTIALAAKELERLLTRHDERGAIDDVRLIRAQVDRCRGILEGMAADAGQSAGESATEVAVRDLVQLAVEGLKATPPVNVDVAGAAAETLRVPRRALAQALKSLLKNAQEASSGDGAVELRASVAGARVRFEVRDHGSGMAAPVLARAGEPFFTTKPPGGGMGLGLFLTRTVAERLGGELELSSRHGQGTVATLSLPLAHTSAASASAATTSAAAANNDRMVRGATP